MPNIENYSEDDWSTMNTKKDIFESDIEEDTETWDGIAEYDPTTPPDYDLGILPDYEDPWAEEDENGYQNPDGN